MGHPVGMATQDTGTAATPVTRDDPPIWHVDDALWAELRPLLVIAKPRKKPGRPRPGDRPRFDGLSWLARNGGPWATLLRQFGAKSTVHARFLEWVEHGCFVAAWARLLAVYDDEVGLDRQWHAADGCPVQTPRGKKGGPARRKRPGPTPPTGASAASSGTC